MRVGKKKKKNTPRGGVPWSKQQPEVPGDGVPKGGGPGVALQALVEDLRGAGYEVGGQTYKRVPRGYDPNHERADLLRHSALFAASDTPHPPGLGGVGFVGWCDAHFRAVAPLLAWMREHVTD